jgi:hypothetical protein
MISGGFSEAVTSTGEAMAGRRSNSKQGKALAAGATLALLALWHAGPAGASSNTPLVPGDVTNSADELEALSPAHSLSPGVKAAQREVSEEAATTPLAADDDKPLGNELPAVTTRLPGISDERLARYKRQMYRTDI